MRDSNFLTENNAKHLWHPMAHAGDMRAHPPRIIKGASGVEITDLNGNTVIDAVGGLWNVPPASTICEGKWHKARTPCRICR